jgi:hypothetical protein
MPVTVIIWRHNFKTILISEVEGREKHGWRGRHEIGLLERDFHILEVRLTFFIGVKAHIT